MLKNAGGRGLLRVEFIGGARIADAWGIRTVTGKGKSRARERGKAGREGGEEREILSFSQERGRVVWT